MTRRMFVLLVLIAATPALALHKPETPDELRELSAIKQEIELAKTQNVAWTIEAAVLKHEKTGSVDPDQNKIDASNARLMRIADAHKTTMDDIARRLDSLYAIHPKDQDGIVLPGFTNRKPDWKPEYVPMHAYRDTVKEDGTMIRLYAPGPYSAISWADGTVEFTDLLLKFSSGYAAAILFHESIHFEQFTTKGRGDKTDLVRKELEAHSESSNPDNQRILGLTHAESAAVNRVFKDQMDAFSNSNQPDNMSMQFVEPEDVLIDDSLSQQLTAVRAAVQKAADIKERDIQATIAQLRKERDLQQRQDALNDEMNRVMAENRERIAQEDSDQSQKTTDAITAALTPESQTAAFKSIEAENVGTVVEMIRRVCLSNVVLTTGWDEKLFWFPNPNVDLSPYFSGLRGNSCASALADQVIALNKSRGRLTAAWINARANSVLNPPVQNQLPDPRPSRPNPGSAPCSRTVTSNTAGISVSHPCR